MTQVGQQHTAGRIEALDVLRCVAVLLVLFRHVDGPEHVGPAPVGAALEFLHSIGWVGVDLFFVLSGFLVAGLLFDERRCRGVVDVGRFLWRRGFKIYPSYYTLLVATLLLRDGLPAGAGLAEALFVQNYAGVWLWPHTWSLAVEEHFYLLLAGGFALANLRPGRGASRAVPFTLLAVCALALALRLQAPDRDPPIVALFPTHLRLDALAFGSVLAWCWTFHRERTQALAASARLLLALLAVLAFVPAALLPVEQSRAMRTFGLCANSVGAGAVLLLALTARPRASRLRSELARLGACSYSIYLWHLPVHEYCRWHVAPVHGHGMGALCYLFGSLLAGMLAARCLELPLLRLRDRLPWFRARRQASPSSA